MSKAVKTIAKRDVKGKESEESITAPAGLAFNATLGGIFGVDAAKAPPQQKVSARSGGVSNTSSAILRGYLVGINKDQGASKVRVNVSVDAVVHNGDMSLIQSGIPGYDFFLPVRKLDLPSQNEGGSKNKFQAKPKELVIDEFCKARWAGMVSPSIWVESKGNEPTGVDKLTAGTYVELRGVHASISNANGKLYLNASRIICLEDAPCSGVNEASRLIEAGMSKNTMMLSAFLWSMTMRGFLSTNYDTIELQTQAQACVNLWSTARSNIAKGLQRAAEAAKDDNQVNCRKMATLIEDMEMLELVSSGRPLGEEEYDSLAGAIVCTGLTPHQRLPEPFSALLSGDAKKCEHLPSYFMTAIPSSVTSDANGSTTEIEFKLQWVWDKRAALETIKQARADGTEVSPVTHTGDVAGAAVKLSTKQVAWALGTRHKSKVEWAKEEVFMCPRAVFFVKPCARDPHASGGLEIGWPNSWKLDLPGTLKNIGFKVTEEWVVKTLCGGQQKAGQASYSNDDLIGDEELALPDKVSGLPTFSLNGFQEVLAKGFKFVNMKVDATKGESRQWYVLYKGATDALRQKPSLSTNTKFAEDMLETLAAAAEEDIEAWVKSSALVYAVYSKDADTLAEE